MARSSVDAWIVKYVKKLVAKYGYGAHDVLFDHNPAINGGLFDCVTAHMKIDKPELHRNIRARVYAVTRFNGNAEEVDAVLSM